MVLVVVLIGAGALLLLVLSLSADKKDEEPPPATAQEAILGAVWGITEDYIEGTTKVSRQVYIEACNREVGIDIQETDIEELELVMEALLKRAEMAEDTGSKVSEDWYCCAAGAEYEYNELHGQLDGFWAYWDNLGMGFWEDLNDMAGAQGVAWECAVGNWTERAYQKVEEFWGDARDWAQDLF